MIIGRLGPGEPSVRLRVELRCTACGRRVPGGLRAAEALARSGGVAAEVERLRGSYVCGPCRDAVRTGSRRRGPRARSGRTACCSRV